MAVGVVARDPLAKPQDDRHAELVAQDRFDLAATEPGVPDLHGGIEQTLLGGEQSPAPVHIDAAAFEHHVARTGPRAEQPEPEPRGDALGNPVVLFPVGVLSPRVEAEPRDRHLRPGARPPHE